jgi:hypothetical protein
MSNASIAQRLIAVVEPNDQTSRVLVSEAGGPSPPCVTVVVSLRERATYAIARRTPEPRGHPNKKN